MKIKDNEKIKKLKEKKESFLILWNNPRYKAIIKLSIWFILILILSLFVRIGNTLEKPVIEQKPSKEVKTEKTVKQQLKEITSYEAIIAIDDNTLTKKVVNDSELINYQNNTYYFENDNTSDNVNEVVVKTLFFNIKNIYSLIENIDEEYTTKYKDGKYVTNYKVSNKDFLQKYSNEEIDIEEFINITIEGQEKINKITIDLNGVNAIDYNNVTIELSNINNIDSIEVGE